MEFYREIDRYYVEILLVTRLDVRRRLNFLVRQVVTDDRNTLIRYLTT